jgi:hypothetical protein
MVRVGVLSHPADWQWCCYRKLIGEKERYRLIDMEWILKSLGISDTCLANYSATLE